MVRPNGSTIGWNRWSGEINEEPLITCLAGSARACRDVAGYNLGTFRGGYNPNAAGAEQISVRRAARGQGQAPRPPGLGSMMVVGGEVKSPGLRITWTGTVAVWNLGIANVTEKPASGAGTSTEQGVLQPGPNEVVASAPGGSDSSATFVSGGADLKESSEKDEHPARLAQATAIAMTRRMIDHSDVRQSATWATIRAQEQSCTRVGRNRYVMINS